MKKRPSSADFFELGKQGKIGKEIHDTYLAWEAARSNLDASIAAMSFIRNQEGTDPKGSSAWKAAGTWTRAERSRRKKALDAYASAKLDPPLCDDFSQVLAYIQSRISKRYRNP